MSLLKRAVLLAFLLTPVFACAQKPHRELFSSPTAIRRLLASITEFARMDKVLDVNPVHPSEHRVHRL
jgi:hypothetical protein